MNEKILNPPKELIDPDGEGIYILSETIGWPGVHRRAAMILFGDMREWRNVDTELAYFLPTETDEWRHANTGRWPRHWRLNLPRRWRPVLYAYCTPKAE